MTLGLTNGSNNSGLGRYNANTAFLNQTTSIYGVAVGSTYTGTSSTELTGSMGITTDPTKSGMIISKDSTKYLMFYIN